MKIYEEPESKRTASLRAISHVLFIGNGLE